MKILGLRSTRDHLRWCVLDGNNRASAKVVDAATLKIPAYETRGEALAWIRTEIQSLLTHTSPDIVSLAPAEGRTVSNALMERCQVDGVVLEVVTTCRGKIQTTKSPGVRAAFACKNKSELEIALDGVHALDNIGKSSTRREPIVVALCAFHD